MRPVATVAVIVACLVTGACASVRGAAGEAPMVIDQAPSEVTTEELGGVRRVRRELDRLSASDERIEALGNTADAVSVELRADAESLAARLDDKYGDAVELLVGGMPFPLPSKIPDDLRCPSPPVQPWPAGVTASLELDDETVPQGRSTHGVVTVKNTSDEQFVLEVEGPVLGWVYDVGDRVDAATILGSSTKQCVMAAASPPVHDVRWRLVSAPASVCGRNGLVRPGPRVRAGSRRL